MNKQCGIVLSYLGVGKQYAKKQDYLSAMTGYKKREIRLIINELRKEYCIVSGNDGYYITEDPVDIRKFLKRQEHQIKEMQDTSQRMKEHLYHIEFLDNL